MFDSVVPCRINRVGPLLSWEWVALNVARQKQILSRLNPHVGNTGDVKPLR